MNKLIAKTLTKTARCNVLLKFGYGAMQKCVNVADLVQCCKKKYFVAEVGFDTAGTFSLKREPVFLPSFIPSFLPSFLPSENGLQEDT